MPSPLKPTSRWRRMPVRWLTWTAFAAAIAASSAWPVSARAIGLTVSPRSQACDPPAPATHPGVPLPDSAAQRIPDSQVAAGRQDVAWVWLGSPTERYPHRALGAATHAASVHALVKAQSGGWRLLSHHLPLHRVYEDRMPRIADIDGDGLDEIVLVEADALRGASLVVLGVDPAAGEPRLVERARSAFAGSPFRWLNPVGVADFDGDGQLDIAVIYTPHIGGELQLLHWRPPALVPFARALDVSNHRMGALEQTLAVIVQARGQRPTLIVPDMTLRALHVLRWDAPGQWTELAHAQPLPGRVERLSAIPGGACVVLDDGRAMAALLAF